MEKEKSPTRPIFCFVLLSFLVSGCAAAQGKNTWAHRESAHQELEIHDKINEERTRHHLTRLRRDDALCTAALRHSQSMGGRSFFSHVDPVRGDLSKRMEAQGLKYRACGENIFKSGTASRFSDSAVRAWMKSPGHKKNILSREYVRTGIGISRGKDGNVYVTQIFASP